MNNNAEFKNFKCNTFNVTNECSRIPSEGLWTNSSWFLWIRVEALYEALVVRHKWGTHKQAKHIIYECAIWNDARHKVIEKELEKVDQTLTHGYVSRFEHTALRPRLHTERFPLTCPHRTPTQGTSSEDMGQYNNREYTTPLSIEYNLSLEAMHNQHKIHLTQEG